jgi:hypothetical protein
MYGQDLVDMRTQTKNVDFSGAASTIPAQSGTALPATCSVGAVFFKTNNAAGQNLYSCAPANTWSLVAGNTGGTVSSAMTGQFGFYAANGSTIIGHTLLAGDIPALNYQLPLTFTGNGSKTASSTGTLLNNDCAKWDPSGNIIDAGSPCANVSSGTAGQFSFYSASGNTLTPHTLTASDIPVLNYQSPLTFTGNGAKTASSTGTLTTNDCAKWDVNGNITDAGSPCASVATGSSGQFGFYSATGNALTPHTLAASDIPALNYQSPLSFTGSGAKTASSTGALTASDCAKWDANGNVVDAGSPCASVAAGATGQFAFYSATGSALTAHSLVASDIPALNYQAPLSFTGTGAKAVSSTGAGFVNNCAKWDSNGNIVDAGAPCGSGSGGGGGITAPASTTVGNVPQYSNTAGSALSTGLGIVTVVGTPGSDTNVPSERSVRTAIASAITSSGNVPAQIGTASYLVSNGTALTWGNIATGPSGGLDCASTPGQCDLVTAIVPLKASANSWTGNNNYQGAAALEIPNGSGPPSGTCSSANVNAIYGRSDVDSSAGLYMCQQTASGTYSWVLQGGGSSGGYSVGISTATVASPAFSLAVGQVQKMTLTGNVSFSVSGGITGGTYVFDFIQGSGGYAVIAPANFHAGSWFSSIAAQVSGTHNTAMFYFDGTNYIMVGTSALGL